MRYKLKEKPKPKPTEIIGRKGPELGDKKSVTKFAYLPKRINGYMVWLESYTINYVYRSVRCKRMTTTYDIVTVGSNLFSMDHNDPFMEAKFYTKNKWKIDNIELK